MSTMTNPYAPPKAAVRDISMPDASLVLADRGTRLGAAILDGIVMAVMVYVPFLVIAIFAGASGAANPDALESGGMPPVFMFGFLLMFVGFVAWSWLTILYVHRNGQTIAKKWLKIKVVRTDGSPASLGRIFWLRNVVNGLLGIIPLYGLVEVLFIFGEAQQCLHDKLADTIVVKE
jgi:uncharacterized RDD family membrane protein YckC